jgi:hypothetical protein
MIYTFKGNLLTDITGKSRNVFHFRQLKPETQILVLGWSLLISIKYIFSIEWAKQSPVVISKQYNNSSGNYLCFVKLIFKKIKSQESTL